MESISNQIDSSGNFLGTHFSSNGIVATIQTTGAGRPFRQALELLSDGAFKLFAYLVSVAARKDTKAATR